MKRTALRLSLLLACAAPLSLACVTKSASGPHSGIGSAPLWHSFLEMPPESALALAGNPNGRWVGGASGGHASPVEAEQSALAECQKRRVARRMQAPCRLYATTGGQIVWKTR